MMNVILAVKCIELKQLKSKPIKIQAWPEFVTPTFAETPFSIIQLVNTTMWNDR